MLISVVTISFNQAAFLDEALRSVLDQGYPALDHVVVDAGSTDGSRDILARLSSRLGTLILEPDRGPADGLRKGFAAARGEIFGYINADDRLAPGALQFVAEYFAHHPEVDVLCGAIRIIDEHGTVSLRKRTSDRFDIARYCAGVCTIGQQATFIRRSAYRRVEGFNASNKVSWDGELLVDLALAGARFATTRKVLGDWRQYADTITGGERHRERLRQETLRIARKAAARGVNLYSPTMCELLRLRYKANLFRHLTYLLAH